MLNSLTELSAQLLDVAPKCTLGVLVNFFSYVFIYRLVRLTFYQRMRQNQIEQLHAVMHSSGLLTFYHSLLFVSFGVRRREMWIWIKYKFNFTNHVLVLLLFAEVSGFLKELVSAEVKISKITCLPNWNIVCFWKMFLQCCCIGYLSGGDLKTSANKNKTICKTTKSKVGKCVCKCITFTNKRIK